MNQPPNRQTRPLGGIYPNRGDTFTSSRPGGMAKATQPLNQSPEALQAAVSKRVSEINQELPNIRDLLKLFSPYVRILELAEQLQEFSPEEIEEALIEPEPLIEEPPVPMEEPILISEDSTDEPLESPETELEIAPEVEPVPIIEMTGVRKLLWDFNLMPENQEMAIKIAARLRQAPRIKQRAQVTIFQFNDAAESYQNACQVINAVFDSTPPEAWGLLEQIGIERLKGKAYAINGFYDHFKEDPVLGKLFPPPHFSPVQITPNLSGQRAPATTPLPETALPPPKPEPKKGLFGNLKGFLGK